MTLWREAKSSDAGLRPECANTGHSPTADANDRAEFLSAVDELGYARKRDGAYAWGVYEDVADGGRFIETFSIESWLEVLHQRERATNADEMLRSRIRQLLKEAPRITFGVSPERPHRHWRKRAGEPGR
jgi:hypothetical protein